MRSRWLMLRHVLREYLHLIWMTLRRFIWHPILSIYRTYLLRRTLREWDAELQKWVVVPVIHHDASFLIVNKPADVNIDEGGGKYVQKCNARKDSEIVNGRPLSKRPTVEYVLQCAFPSYHLRNVHQLDYATSGIYVIALTKKAASEASTLFYRRDVAKTYLALVSGHVQDNEQTVTVPIGNDPDRPTRMIVNGLNPKIATTDVLVLRRGYALGKPATLVQLKLLTGRTHQLRVHMKHIGHPILGDLAYENEITPSFRMMLHAWKLELYFNKLPALDNWSKSYKKRKGFLDTFKRRLKCLSSSHSNEIFFSCNMTTPGRTVPLECLLSVCLELVYSQQDNKAEADLIGDDLFLEGFLKTLTDAEPVSDIRWRSVDLKFVADFFHGYRRYEKLIHATMDFVFPSQDNGDGSRPTVLRLDYITTTIVLYFLLFRLAGVQDINLAIFKIIIEWAVSIRGDWLSKLALQVSRVGRKGSTQKAAADSGFGGLMEMKINDVVKASTKLWNLGFTESDVPTNVPYITDMGCIVACWCKVLDEAFVSDKLVAPLVEISAPLSTMMKEMEELRVKQVDGIKVKSTRKLTMPDPFCLTQPRPRKVILPKPIPKTRKALPLPKQYQNPTGFPSFEKQLQVRKEKALERARKLHDEANKKQFLIVQKTSDLMQRKINKRSDNTPVIPKVTSTKGQIDFRNAPKMPVKKTTATVLREDALVRKRIEEEKQRLEDGTAAGILGVTSQSKEELKKYELEKQLVNQEKLRLKVQLSHEEAIVAKEQSVQNRKIQAYQAKLESEGYKKATEKRMKQEKLLNRERVDAVQSTRENVKDAKMKLVEEKKEAASIIEREKEKLRLEREKLKEEDKQRKSEIIRQIKMLLKPKNSIESSRDLDLTTTPGYGLLTEMSVLELQERLTVLKIRQSAEAELKRKQILEEKCRKQDLLLGKLERVQKFKDDVSVRIHGKIRSQQNTPQLKDNLLLDAELSGLKDKLELKKQERRNIQLKCKYVPKGASAIDNVLPEPRKQLKQSRLQDDVNTILEKVNFLGVTESFE